MRFEEAVFSDVLGFGVRWTQRRADGRGMGGSGARGAQAPVLPHPLQIAAALPLGIGCGERMGLLPLEAHNGQRRLREVFALLALRAQPALLGKSNSSTAPTGGDGWTRFSVAFR
jgi:hypothetical protein